MYTDNGEEQGYCLQSHHARARALSLYVYLFLYVHTHTHTHTHTNTHTHTQIRVGLLEAHRENLVSLTSLFVLARYSDVFLGAFLGVPGCS
jgi:hypothetical protein